MSKRHIWRNIARKALTLLGKRTTIWQNYYSDVFNTFIDKKAVNIIMTTLVRSRLVCRL